MPTRRSPASTPTSRCGWSGPSVNFWICVKGSVHPDLEVNPSIPGGICACRVDNTKKLLWAVMADEAADASPAEDAPVEPNASAEEPGAPAAEPEAPAEEPEAAAEEPEAAAAVPQPDAAAADEEAAAEPEAAGEGVAAPEAPSEDLAAAAQDPEAPVGEPGSEATPAVELPPSDLSAAAEGASPRKSPKRKGAGKKAPQNAAPSAAAAEQVRQVRLVAKMLSELPTGQSEESVAEREKLFTNIDANSNGHLSFSELSSGLMLLINQRCGLTSKSGSTVKPAIQRAFAAAREAGGSHRGKRPADSVGRAEFRLLLLYLERYSELLTMFGSLAHSLPSARAPC